MKHLLGLSGLITSLLVCQIASGQGMMPQPGGRQRPAPDAECSGGSMTTRGQWYRMETSSQSGWRSSKDYGIASNGSAKLCYQPPKPPTSWRLVSLVVAC